MCYTKFCQSSVKGLMRFCHFFTSKNASRLSNSNNVLKIPMDIASTVDGAKLFHGLITLQEKKNKRVSSLGTDVFSFHLCPLVWLVLSISNIFCESVSI